MRIATQIELAMSVCPTVCPCDRWDLENC